MRPPSSGIAPVRRPRRGEGPVHVRFEDCHSVGDQRTGVRLGRAGRRDLHPIDTGGSGHGGTRQWDLAAAPQSAPRYGGRMGGRQNGLGDVSAAPLEYPNTSPLVGGPSPPQRHRPTVQRPRQLWVPLPDMSRCSDDSARKVLQWELWPTCRDPDPAASLRGWSVTAGTCLGLWQPASPPAARCGTSSVCFAPGLTVYPGIPILRLTARDRVSSEPRLRKAGFTRRTY
jgi:hypothetical protein